MTDRELLDLAAKAVSIELNWSSVEGVSPRRADTFDSWNPLADDGDALRLAVKLGLPIDFDHSCGAVWAHNPWTGQVFHEPGTADYKGNPASLRRAIVRAAAEIGKSVT